MSHFRTAAKAVLGAGSLALAILVAPVAASGAAPVSPGAPGLARHPGATTVAEQQKVLDYWTPERMRSAVPRDQVVRPTPTAKPAPSTSKAVKVPAMPEFGKVFFTLDGVNYVCSGTVTASANRDLVTTAGHCVNEGPGDFATNFAFVPAYENGVAPYGTWTSAELLTTTAWSGSGDFDYDVGFAVMNERADGKSLIDVTVKSFPVLFDSGYILSVSAYGYPAARPFNGQYLYKCTGTSGIDLLGGSTDHSLPCTMTGGSSGGGWVSSSHLMSLNSFKYTIDSKTMYGPYFGSVIESLYETAQR